MRFFTSTFAGLVALASAVLAAENPISKPDGSAPIAAGKPQTITWNPTTEGTITLTLRKGSSNDLKDVTVITAGAANSGSFTWTPPKDLPAGENYAIMITDAAGETNYTPLIAIDSNVPAEVSSSSASSKYSSKTASATETSTATASKTTKSAEEITSKTGYTLSVPKITPYAHHNSTKMVTKHHNSTTIKTKASNSTKTSTKKSSKTTTLDTTSTSEPTSTDSPTDAPSAAPTDSSAMAIVRSPIALVACMVVALMYLN
ncbi:Ser-Thr-rich glycosyl-phosphatidyl-inositol-anchored membrane family-domain-containing protein [Geopyxis carbonaria]|nr:Ser-Thr-rich glycosyl-phosphatidyl-inositol-anchored membrane family-domain-containing protein [Geopyxis carbonaria]